MIERLCRVAIFASLSLCAASAYASNKVRIVVPFAQGDASDLIARIIAPPLSEKLGWPVTVQNNYGAGGIVGTQDVVRSPTDGLTLVLGSVSNMSMNTACRGERLGYVPSSALRPVAMLARAPVVLAVGQASSVGQFSELLASFSRYPGIQTFSSSGLCSYSDFMGRYLISRAEVDVVSLPYRGGHEATQAVISGDADAVFTELPNAVRDIEAGRLKPLAVSSKEALRNVPNFQEIGYEQLDMQVWYGFFVPAGTPSREARVMQNAIQEVGKNPEIQRQFAAIGAQPYPLVGPEIYREVVNFTRVVEAYVADRGLSLE